MYAQPSGYHPRMAQPVPRQEPGSQPPRKKTKGNPVITYYPPPPGYRGPGQPNVPYQPHWQQNAQPYGNGQAVGYHGYPPQPYNLHAPPVGATQTYHTAQWSGTPQQWYPLDQQAPLPSASPLPAGSYPNPPVQHLPSTAGYAASQSTQPNPLSGPQGMPPHQQLNVMAIPLNAPTQQWQNPSSGPQNAQMQLQQQHHSENSFRHKGIRNPSTSASYGKRATRKVHAVPLDGNGEPLPPADPSIPEDESLESAFDEECYFARHVDEIDPALSIGTALWHAALPYRTALPATFDEAEAEAMAPREVQLDEPSISKYFTKDKCEEALLSVRQTAAWEEVMDDLIFKEFPAVTFQLVSKHELKAHYRDRPGSPLPSFSPETSSPPTPTEEVRSVERMDVDGDHNISNQHSSHDADDQGDMLGNLEQALFSTDASNDDTHNRPSTAGSSYSRAGSVSSQAGEKITRPKLLEPIRDAAQEDVLAALGVTGAPKTVYQTPGPAITPLPSQQNDGHASFGHRDSIPGYQRGFRPPPPPPPPVNQQGFFHNGWQTDDQRRSNGSALDRPKSSSSQHTMAGSDFHPDDNDATPRPKESRTDSGRKRSHGEFEDNGRTEVCRDSDDTTPRPRRKQPRPEGIYGRRW